MGGVNGNITNLNRTTFSALKQVKDPKAMTAEEAKGLQSAILKDGVIDKAESQLIGELTQDSPHNVHIGAQKSADFNPQDLNLTSASGQAKQILGNLRTHPQELDRLWNGGKEGMDKLVKLYSGTPQAKGAVMRFVTSKFQQAWSQSSLGNGYAPLRDAIGRAYAATTSEDPAVSKNGRQMLYDGTANLDRFAHDAIPDFLYSWLKPE